MVGSHYGVTHFKHVLHVSTFNSAMNEPFYSYLLTLQLQLNNVILLNKTEYSNNVIKQ